MRALLDTHAFLWWLDGDPRLSEPARNFIADQANIVLVSAATAWEVTTKVRLGKLPGSIEVAEHLPEILIAQQFEAMPITVREAQRAGALPGIHKDPFDRMLISQALEANIPLVSNERLFERYQIRRIW